MTVTMSVPVTMTMTMTLTLTMTMTMTVTMTMIMTMTMTMTPYQDEYSPGEVCGQYRLLYNCHDCLVLVGRQTLQKAESQGRIEENKVF